MGDSSRGAPDALAELLDAIAVSAFSVDAEYRYRALNQANWDVVRAIYGTDPHVGDNLFEIMGGGEDVGPMQAAIDRALAGETVSQAHWYGVDPRERRYFRFTFTPMRSAGEVDGVAAVGVDETELYRAREALRLSDDRFKAAFRASPDAININRLSDGMYVEINPSFTRLTGYTPEDVEGRTSLDISIWADPHDRERLVAGLQQSGAVDQLAADFRQKDGMLRPGEMSAVIITVADQPCILSVTRDVSERNRTRLALEESYARLERMSQDMVETVGKIVEARDPYTQGHERRAAALCRLIGLQMGMSASDIQMLVTTALVHDIGKMSVPAEILTKPGHLTPTELELVRGHSQSGYDILKDIAFGGPIAEIVLQHHERQDGSGYPRGLRGDEIMMAARILAVADVVEAMSSHRPYRPSLGMEAAVMAVQGDGTKYDPDVVAALLELWRQGALVL